jgi:hypothetical protein
MQRRTAIRATKIALNTLFAIPLVICFIVNLATAHTLTWFFIVLFSLLLAYSVIVLPFMLKNHRAIISMIAFTASLLILIGVCRIWGPEFSLRAGWGIAVFCLVFAWAVFVIIRYTRFALTRKVGSSLVAIGVLVASTNRFVDLLGPQAETVGDLDVYAGALLVVVGLVLAVFAKSKAPNSSVSR